MVEINNNELEYCLARLKAFPIKTEYDLIFQIQCTYALWLSIYKEQPELDYLDYFNRNQLESLRRAWITEQKKVEWLEACLQDEKYRCEKYKQIANDLGEAIRKVINNE